MDKTKNLVKLFRRYAEGLVDRRPFAYFLCMLCCCEEVLGTFERPVLVPIIRVSVIRLYLTYRNRVQFTSDIVSDERVAKADLNKDSDLPK
jgi:hypothetical protein